MTRSPLGPIERIEPTQDEADNGWTSATLSTYVHEARQRQSTVIAAGMSGGRRGLPRMQSKRGGSLKWGRGRQTW